MKYKSQEQEIKKIRTLAVISAFFMVIIFILLVTYKQDSLLSNFSTKNKDIILMLAMLIPIGFILKLLYDKTKEAAELREQFYQSQKMEAIGRLAGGIAHDFNNILASSTGYAEFLVEDLADIDPKLQNFAKQILLANKQAQKLVEQILSFSRKQENIDMSYIDLKEAIPEMLELLKSRIKQGIELKSEIVSKPVIVKANHSLLHQIIMNLCVNAVDAMIPNKKGILQVTVVIDKIPEDIKNILNLKSKENFINKLINKVNQNYLINGNINTKTLYAIITIKDNGSGIEKEILKQIFDPFFTTKGTNKGTGLGLSSALNIVEMHKGSIIVKTKENIGTEFMIFLPIEKNHHIYKDANNQNNQNIEKNKQSQQKYILLIEDDISVAGTMEIMLERMGYESLHCLNPLEAIDLLDAGEKFDLIISDYKMPHMTGLEMAKNLYKKYPKLKIIMTTGFSDKKIGTQLKNTAITTILKKPANQDEIKKAINEAFKE